MIPASGQETWDECHLVIRNMATLPPFWDSEWRLYRHSAIGLIRMALPYNLAAKARAPPSNQSGKLKALGGHNHKAIYKKNEYTTHRALFDGRGVVPHGTVCDAYRMF
jgi:hypothetical protein